MVANALKSVEDTSIEEPTSYVEAMNSKNNNNYIKAMRGDGFFDKETNLDFGFEFKK